MQLISIVVLSAVTIQAAFASSIHRSYGGLHAHDAMPFHRSLARDIRTSLKRAPAERRARMIKKKRSSSGTQKRCIVRPTASSQEPEATTTTSTGSTSIPTTSISSSSATPTSTPVENDSPWKLRNAHQGNTFFDDWDFWSFNDPTHGVVDYQNRENSWNRGLISINEKGNAIMRIDDTPFVEGNRASVRIHDRNIFNGGTLLVLDAVHMPYGPATWPAFWSNGENWPFQGEIDILEGVHNGPTNQASIHTGSGCRIPEDTNRSTGQLHGGNNCASYESGNSGCGFQDHTPNNYGENFNKAGGGVYAMQWVDEGISVWFFSRDDIPEDLESENPHPENWGKPFAFWSSESCHTATFFKDHFAIFTNTLCGDWAGNTFGSLGLGSCEQYVRENGAAFSDAYWEVRYVKLFQL